MNTIELQSIVFILIVALMFLTTPSNRHPIKSAIAGHDCDVWTHVTLTVDFPWYCLSYTGRSDATTSIGGTELLSKPDQVAELLSQADSAVQVEQLLLVSPPRLNRTKQWQMECLSEIWRGQFKGCINVYLYVLRDGRRYVDSPNPEAWQELKNLTLLVQFFPPQAN